ncbi:hypothetical protein L218DRAFT_949610 [Marasmius fiardii PR-910]|nr:hypothetical protein L218DRAFT_949610 [Marasmius fiardii PR-910]
MGTGIAIPPKFRLEVQFERWDFVQDWPPAQTLLCSFRKYLMSLRMDLHKAEYTKRLSVIASQYDRRERRRGGFGMLQTDSNSPCLSAQESVQLEKIARDLETVSENMDTLVEVTRARTAANQRQTAQINSMANEFGILTALLPQVLGRRFASDEESR